MATKAEQFAKTGAIWGAVLGAVSVAIFFGIAHVAIAGILAGAAIGAISGAVNFGLLGGVLGLFFKKDAKPEMQQTVDARSRQQEPQQGISQQAEVPQQNPTQFQDRINSQREQQPARTLS